MNTRARLGAAFTAAAAALALMGGPASAGVRQTFPGEDAGPPSYVTGVNDHDWGAIFFVRSSDCVPDDANLLAFNPAVFGCTLAVEGFAVYEQQGDLAPRHAELAEAGPLEVWFLSTEDLAPAVADGVLTKAELAAVDSLVLGSATEYRQTIHPEPAANHVVVSLTARGTLSDGRTFSVHATLRDYQSSRFPVQLCGCHEGPVTIRFR